MSWQEEDLLTKLARVSALAVGQAIGAWLMWHWLLKDIATTFVKQVCGCK